MKHFLKNSISVLVDEDQALAVGMILQRDLVLLTGGPGTGRLGVLWPCLPLMHMKIRKI